MVMTTVAKVAAVIPATIAATVAASGTTANQTDQNRFPRINSAILPLPVGDLEVGGFVVSDRGTPRKQCMMTIDLADRRCTIHSPRMSDGGRVAEEFAV